MSSPDESVLYRLKNLIDHSVIAIHKNPFKIGRATTNDLAIENNRFISSAHCIFEFDQGHVYIRDTSSNGTLINRTKKIHKNDTPIELQSGDIIHLVFRKDEPGSNVIYQLDLLPPKTKLVNTTDQKLKRKLSESKENLNQSTSINDGDMKRVKGDENLTSQAREEMEDILTCLCCQDIMTNPICLEPCLHAFCHDCYGSWEVVQRTCPKCRVKVTAKKKNVVINGILEAFFKAYPEKRPALKVIDVTQQQTNARVQIQSNIVDDDDDDEEEEEGEEEEEEMDDVDDNRQIIVMMTTPVPSPRFLCRQCPPGNATNYQCRPGQNHILCQCCVQPMPDRQGEPNIHQSCEMCHQYFCNMYFSQCQRKDCLGCLNQLRNMNFAPHHLTNFVNDNPVETQIVQNYLSKHRLSSRDLLVYCCQRLDRKEFTCTNIDQNAAIPSSKIVCYQCGLKLFKELAYQFRVSMKPNDIHPTNLRHRENCYYGRRCRTQFTKPGHAQKLNHACDQVKF